MQTVLRGPSAEVIIGPDEPVVMIGERINPTGRKVFSAELQAGDLSRIPRDALDQAEAGAMVLDVNVGAASVDEVALLPRAVQIVQEAVDLPVCLDSANPAALAAALKVVKGRALINSVNGESDKLAAVLPLVAEYGAAVIALCMDDSGIPATPEARLAVAEAILEQAHALGIPPEDIVFDPLVMAVGADHTAGATTLATARLIRERARQQHDRWRQQRVARHAGPRSAQHGVPGAAGPGRRQRADLQPAQERPGHPRH